MKPLSFKLLLLLTTVFVLAGCNQYKAHTDAAATSLPNTLSKQEIKDGWKLLFDGNSYKGWTRYGGAAVGRAWIIRDSSIFLNANRNAGDWQSSDGGDIITTEAFSDFHLQYDWKIEEGGNSGVIFYVNDDTSLYKHPWQTGPEMQVLDNEKHSDAKIHKHRAGDLYDLIAASSEPVKPALQWNHAAIKSVKGKLTFYLNGIRIVDTQLWNEEWKKLVAGSKFKSMPGFGTFTSGKISLQDHGDKVWFRNIKIRRL